MPTTRDFHQPSADLQRGDAYVTQNLKTFRPWILALDPDSARSVTDDAVTLVDVYGFRRDMTRASLTACYRRVPWPDRAFCRDVRREALDVVARDGVFVCIREADDSRRWVIPVDLAPRGGVPNPMTDDVVVNGEVIARQGVWVCVRAVTDAGAYAPTVWRLAAAIGLPPVG